MDEWVEERFVERKKCKRGQAKTKTRIKKKTKAQTKGCGENKKHGGEKEKRGGNKQLERDCRYGLC